MESSTNAIVVLDPGGRIRLANRRCSELSGYSQTELKGAPFRTLFAGLSLHLVQQAIANISSGRSHSVCLETELCRRDGQPTEISFGAAPFTQEGESAGIVVSIEDITNRKLWENQLKSFAAELEESNAELKSFAYIISHDLRAPLVNIKGFAAELNGSLHDLALLFRTLSPLLGEGDRDRLATLFDQDIPEALDFINGSVVRMDGLINAILKLSRIGHRELKAEPVPLREMVDAILKSMFHQIEERHSQVSIGELGELRSDRMALEQILGNLLDNAVKYLDPGRPGELEISGTSDVTGATIHIRDNGRGIAQEDIARIFEVFRRAGRQDVQGEGMGLAYVKALVRKLHGQIWCRSELGVGSTFSFTIPHGGSPNGSVGTVGLAGGGKLSDPVEGEHDEPS
jgi:PAS domain S-box-containing protein